MTPKPKINCAACGKQITDKKYVTCTLSSCKKQYHNLCVNFVSTNTDAAASWACPDCLCSMKKGGDNSSTPARASQNITFRKPRAGSSDKSPQAESSSPLDKLTQEINLLRQEIVSMRCEFDVAITAVRQCENRLESFCATVSTLESRIARVEEKTEDMASIKNMNDRLQKQLTEQAQNLSMYESQITQAEQQVAAVAELRASNEILREQVNSHAQALLRNDIEISGVTETAGENSHHVFLTLAAVAGMKPLDSDIEYVTRVGQHRNGANDLPRPMVIRFSRRNTRDQFLKLAKSKRLTTKDISVEGPIRKIYFNDRLTKEQRLLFRECRREIKEKAGFKFCWTTGGQIYVKKHEGRGKGATALQVKNHSDINRILCDLEKCNTNNQAV